MNRWQRADKWRNRMLWPRVGLYLGSKPTECGQLSIDDVDTQKLIHCRRYANCVEHAAGLAWENFNCGRCKIQDELTPTAKYSDFDGLAELLAEIMGHRGSGVTDPRNWRAEWLLRRYGK